MKKSKGKDIIAHTHAHTLLLSLKGREHYPSLSLFLSFFLFYLFSFIVTSMQYYSPRTSTTIRDTMRNSTDYAIPLAESARSSSVVRLLDPLLLTGPHSFSLTSLVHLQPSIPPERRPSQSINLDNRLRQLEKENEELTHSNVRLLRANRILKLDSDRVVDEQVNELKEEIKHLRYQNVRLQRSNRLLQEDLNQHIVSIGR